jgi:hypothetical protein
VEIRSSHIESGETIYETVVGSDHGEKDEGYGDHSAHTISTRRRAKTDIRSVVWCGRVGVGILRRNIRTRIGRRRTIRWSRRYLRRRMLENRSLRRILGYGIIGIRIEGERGINATKHNITPGIGN